MLTMIKRRGITVAAYNNNGMFGNVNKSVNANFTEHELIQYLSKEKHRLAAELEIKYEEASLKRIRSQEQKLKQLFIQEKQNYQTTLKAKYSNMLKSMLHDKEQEIATKYSHEYSAVHAKLHKQIKQLKQAMAQQQQNINIQIREAQITAKQEQKQNSRSMYERMLKAAQADIALQEEQKQEAALLQKEQDLRNEYEISLKQSIDNITAEYTDKLQKEISAKEQMLTQMHNEELAKQSDLFAERIKQEVNNATTELTRKLQAEFAQERADLNTTIESMRPEYESNKIRIRAEIEQEIRTELTQINANYQAELEKAKHAEVAELLNAEKDKLTQLMQEENMVILKYKEREMREKHIAEHEEEWQTKLRSALQEQEQIVRAELHAEFNSTISELQSTQASKIEELLQENALLSTENAALQANAKKELADAVALETQKLDKIHQAEIQALEAQLQQANNLASLDASNLQEVLAEQEQRLHAYNNQQHAKSAIAHKQEIIAYEQKLRREFQTMLDEQRRQAAINFAKQRDKEVQEALTIYQEKLTTETKKYLEDETAEIEKALKAEYSARLKKHYELVQIETDRMKESLKAEQNDKIQNAVNQQLEVINKAQELKLATFANEQDEKLKLLVEDERKKINIKFAQDKANLIKDLTDRFTKEKHIAISQHENELREKLHKEMVKQKDFIQAKFTQVQETALQEQKRRLEAKHKHEIDRIKQGYFDPKAESNYDDVTIGHNVEKLAEKILSKFQKA